jgi:hypothetical protein
MEKMLDIFPGAELIPDWDWSVPPRTRDRLLDLLSTQPCTLEEICSRLDLSSSDAIKYCKIMERDCLISRKLCGDKLCFQAPLKPYHDY